MKCTYCKHEIPKGEVTCPSCGRAVAISPGAQRSFWITLLISHMLSVPFIGISAVAVIILGAIYVPDYASQSDNIGGLFIAIAGIIQFISFGLNVASYIVVDRAHFGWKKGYDVLLAIPLVLFSIEIVVMAVCAGLLNMFDALSPILGVIVGLFVQIFLLSRLRKLRKMNIDLAIATDAHEEKTLGRFNL